MLSNINQSTIYGVSSLEYALLQTSVANISSDIDLKNSYRVINALAAVNPNDYTTLAQVQSLIVLGTSIPLNDISTGFPNTGDTTFNNYKITNLANGTSNNDAVNLGQLQAYYPDRI